MAKVDGQPGFLRGVQYGPNRGKERVQGDDYARHEVHLACILLKIAGCYDWSCQDFICHLLSRLRLIFWNLCGHLRLGDPEEAADPLCVPALLRFLPGHGVAQNLAAIAAITAPLDAYLLWMALC